MIINPFIWLSILGLIYLVGIVLLCGVIIAANKVFNMGKTLTFKNLFTDCILGALIGIILAVLIFNIFSIKDYTGSYPDFNTKLLQACCFLPALTIILKIILSLKRQKN